MNYSPHNEDARFLELLQKWRSGDFTRSDEQEINALASGDEFRRETLDGFFSHPEYDHATSISLLRDRIRAKHKSRRLGIPQILSLAAALTLLFSAIWFFNIRPIPTGTGEIAQQLPLPTDIQKETSTTALPAPTTATPRLDKVPASPSVNKDLEASQRAAGSGVDQGNDDIMAEKVQDNDLADATDKLSKSAQAPGVVRQESNNVATPREMAEESAKRSKASSDDAKPAPSYDEKKAKKEKAGKNISTTQPRDGWPAFRNYLNANAHLTALALANNVSGTVRLEFSLDGQSRPTGFQIIRGLGYGCDEEAIKLVKSVSWTGAPFQPVTVDVPFVH